MALKKILIETEYNALTDEATKALYKKGADNKYHLDLEEDDAAALKAAKEHEKNARKAAEERAEAAERKLKEQEDARRAAEEEAARKAGDVTALEASWKQKRDTDVAAAEKRAGRAEGSLKRVLVDNVAQRLATEISTAPALLVEVIKKRLAVEIPTDETFEPITRVLDAAGRPSALSVNDLKQEIIDNPEYAAIIKASSASGGGAAPQRQGGGAPTNKKKLSEMTATEEATFANEHPEEYAKLVGQG